MKIHSYLPHLATACLIMAACSSESSNGGNGSNAGTSAGGSVNNTAGTGGAANGSSGTSNASGSGGTSGGAANNTAGDAGAGGVSAGGTAGTSPGGAAGEANAGAGGASGGSGGAGADDECIGNPPPAPIEELITAQPNVYQHNVGGHPFAVDLRVPKIVGKLIVDMGVSSGGIFGFGRDRGYHTYGGEIQPQCTLTYDDGPPHLHNGDCRLNRVDGKDYNGENTDNEASSLFGNLKAGLQQLATQAPGQGWEYFLDSDGELRLQDIGFTGYSHGAQTAARIGTAYCVWRAVSRSGPRDNECGNGTMDGNWDSVNGWPSPPYKEDCDRYSEWIMDTPASPMSHFYSFAGKGDGQFGDDMWTLDHLGGGFLGDPVNISTTPPGDSHRFYADDGHGGFEDYLEAQGAAWDVPPENMAYAAGN